MNKINLAEYIWLDGDQPTQGLRSKARVVEVSENPCHAEFPLWSFDGSSTQQAEGDDSDCILKPVRVVPDPIRSGGGYLVLCEVFNPDGTPHKSNHRADLRASLKAAEEADPWLGFEQEYTLLKQGRPLGWPESGFPAPQGPYYCGVGDNRVFGRELVDEHAQKCLQADLLLHGINAEVMPGQWEFQIGYRGMAGETGDALRVSDHLHIARWLLHRLGESYGIEVSFSNKPIKGDWNGAGMHTNFSTEETRDPLHGLSAIGAAIDALHRRHDYHIERYGHGLEERLTGLHETCDIQTFKSGIAHRGASIRIPQPVAQRGHGYLEDRRPGANADPYVVAACLVSTVCGEREARHHMVA